MTTQIQMRLRTDEKDLIKKASRLVGVGTSTFSRIASLEKAHEIIKKIGDTNGETN